MAVVGEVILQEPLNQLPMGTQYAGETVLSFGCDPSPPSHALEISPLDSAASSFEGRGLACERTATQLYRLVCPARCFKTNSKACECATLAWIPLSGRDVAPQPSLGTHVETELSG